MILVHAYLQQIELFWCQGKKKYIYNPCPLPLSLHFPFLFPFTVHPGLRAPAPTSGGLGLVTKRGNQSLYGLVIVPVRFSVSLLSVMVASNCFSPSKKKFLALLSPGSRRTSRAPTKRDPLIQILKMGLETRWGWKKGTRTKSVIADKAIAQPLRSSPLSESCAFAPGPSNPPAWMPFTWEGTSESSSQVRKESVFFGRSLGFAFPRFRKNIFQAKDQKSSWRLQKPKTKFFRGVQNPISGEIQRLWHVEVRREIWGIEPRTIGTPLSPSFAGFYTSIKSLLPNPAFGLLSHQHTAIAVQLQRMSPWLRRDRTVGARRAKFPKSVSQKTVRVK